MSSMFDLKGLVLRAAFQVLLNIILFFDGPTIQDIHVFLNPFVDGGKERFKKRERLGFEGSETDQKLAIFQRRI